MKQFHEAMRALPLVAILRGLPPSQAEAVGRVLIDSGFTLLEVPLNSPEPYESIALLAKTYGEQALIGAGTVMSVDEVDRVTAAGGRMIVSPHTDADLIRAAKQRDLVCLPGVATPSEALTALKAGADALKLFPAETLPPKALQAWRAIISSNVLLLPVGGITPVNMQAYWTAGASGFGLGSALYKPKYTLADLEFNARRFVSTFGKLGKKD